MFDANLIIYLVLALAVCSLTWTTFVVIYTYCSVESNARLRDAQPLVRWIFGVLRNYVILKLALVVILTIVQVTRNYYLVAAVDFNVAPGWLFWVVAGQNILFYGLVTMPSVVLFIFTWALSAINQARDDRLDKSTKEYLGLEQQTLERLREREEGR